MGICREIHDQKYISGGVKMIGTWFDHFLAFAAIKAYLGTLLGGFWMFQ